MGKPDIRIFNASRDHLVELAANIRDDDALEIRRTSGRDPLPALEEAFQRSTYTFAARVDGELLVVWGLVRWGLLTGSGAPWMFSTRAVERHKRLFLEGSRVEVRCLARICPNMSVMIDARYKRATRWARWLGFQLTGPMPYGPEGAPFMRATYRAEEVA